MSFVVNMIPNVFSGESNQDSEPNLAIDPADPRRIAGSAFTPDPLGGAERADLRVDRRRAHLDAQHHRARARRPPPPATSRVGFGHQGRLYAGILRRPGGLAAEHPAHDRLHGARRR